MNDAATPEYAELAELTAEELIARGEKMVRLGRELLGLAANASAGTTESEPESEPEPERPRSEDRSVGRFGAVTVNVAKLKAIEMGDFTASEFADTLGLKVSATNRWLSTLKSLGHLAYDRGSYHCLIPPTLHVWATRQTEAFTTHTAVQVTQLTHATVQSELEHLASRGILDQLEEDLFQYAPITDPSPRDHPTKRPPEKDPPSYTQARATGMPVRIRKDTRKMRSTAGQAHRLRQKEARFKEMESVKAVRAEAQKTKAQKDPKWKRKK